MAPTFAIVCRSRCVPSLTVGRPLTLCVCHLETFESGKCNLEGERTMFSERIVKAASSRIKQYQWLSFFILLACALTIHPFKAQAQIVGELEVNIPFQFHAGNAKLPAGSYVLHMLDNSDLSTMEISSADGSISALFEVQNAEANSAPPRSELIFNKYGNRYFLTRIFDEGNPDGSKVPESQYEKRVSKAAAEAQQRVPAHHKGQKGA